MGGGPYKPVTFTFTAPAEGCQGLILGPANGPSFSLAKGYYALDAFNFAPGESGVCNSQGICVARD